jgi:hypothetical protein
MQSRQVGDAGGSSSARLNDAYSRLIECVGDLLIGRSNGIRVRLSFLSVTLALSLAMALGSALIPAVYGLTGQSLPLFSFPLSAMWTVTVVVAVRRCGVRGLWTLIGLPFAIYWPALMALLYAACEWGHDCI